MEHFQLESAPSYNPELNELHEEVLSHIAAARAEGFDGGYVNMATGTGKTRVAARDVQAFYAESRVNYPETTQFVETLPQGLPDDARVLYLCHKTNILSQAKEEFRSILGPDVTMGNIFGGEVTDDAQVTFASFQQLNTEIGQQKLYELIPPDYYQYVVVDESHHGPAETYQQVIEHLQPEFKLGLTATPDRRDQQDMGSLFGPELARVLLEDAIAQGLLARPDYRVLTDHVRKLKELDTDLGKIDLRHLNREIFVKRRDGEIADTIAEHLYERDDPRVIVFCPSIEYAEHIQDFLPGNVATYHSKISEEEQDKRLKAFRSRELDTLITVDMLNEGVDIPEANVLVFLRDTQSRTIFLQQLGRGLRKIAGKEEVLVLDFVASWERIQDIKKLESDVKKSHDRHSSNGKARHAKTPFNFNFSEEALNAIEVVRYAREKQQRPKPKPVNVTPRIEKWAQADAEVIAMLGITGLPDQRLTAHNWQRYAQRLALGDERAKQELVMRRLRSLYGTAKQFSKTFGSNEITVEDHFQHAYEGMENALNTFDIKKHSSLKDHITLHVHQSLHRKAAEGGLVRFPVHVKERLRKIDAAKQKLSVRLGNIALEELPGATVRKAISIATSLSTEQIEEADYLRTVVAYESHDSIEERRKIRSERPEEVDRSDLTPQEQIEEGTRKYDLRDALETLDYRSRRVLELRYGLGGEQHKTLDETGRTFNVTRERVRQIENQALKKLQSIAEAQGLRYSSDDYLDRKKKEHRDRQRQEEKIVRALYAKRKKHKK